jgi:glycosyltransferase involved in cell wall biosynthesis
MKVLIIAAGCDDAAVGEVWSSFQWVSRLARQHDVTLITSRYSRRPPTSLQLPEARVIEWQDPSLFERWQRFNAMLKPGYVSFYWRARRWIKASLHAGERFDIVHQISPLALRYPSPAAGCNVPLVIGPLGGSLEDPEGFRAELDRAPWYTQLRLIDRWRLRHDSLLRNSYASADCLICVAPYVKELLGDLATKRIEFMSETGVVELPPAKMFSLARPLRLLFVGRVIRTKGVRDAIRALAQLKDQHDFSFDVVGDGDDLVHCKREAAELGVNGVVTFHGRLSRKDVDRFYAKADVFVFPSYREPSGNVVLEAMSYGLAMIVADRGGPGFVVDGECGFRVPVTEPRQYATAIANCVRDLIRNPELIASFGKAARNKVRQQFLWNAKVVQLSQLYYDLVAKGFSSEIEHPQDARLVHAGTVPSARVRVPFRL